MMIQTSKLLNGEYFRILEMDRSSGNITIRQEVNRILFRLNEPEEKIYENLHITDIAASNGKVFISDYNVGIFIAQI
jgi:hypothetical protein